MYAGRVESTVGFRLGVGQRARLGRASSKEASCLDVGARRELRFLTLRAGGRSGGTEHAGARPRPPLEAASHQDGWDHSRGWTDEVGGIRSTAHGMSPAVPGGRAPLVGSATRWEPVRAEAVPVLGLAGGHHPSMLEHRERQLRAKEGHGHTLCLYPGVHPSPERTQRWMPQPNGSEFSHRTFTTTRAVSSP